MSIVAQCRFKAALGLIKQVNAGLVRDATGVGEWHYFITPNAPSTFPEVLNVYGEALRLGFPLPVGVEGLEGSIYKYANDNAQFRAAHDVIHYAYKLPFTLEGEIQAALLHVERVARFGEAWGYTPTTIRDAVAVLWLDTYGQASYYEQTSGGFLDNQAAWVRGEFIAYLIATAGNVDPCNIGKQDKR